MINLHTARHKTSPNFKINFFIYFFIYKTEAFYLDYLSLIIMSSFSWKKSLQKGVLFLYLGKPIEYQLLSGLCMAIKLISSLFLPYLVKGSKRRQKISNRPNCRAVCYWNSQEYSSYRSLTVYISEERLKQRF